MRMKKTVISELKKAGFEGGTFYRDRRKVGFRCKMTIMKNGKLVEKTNLKEIQKIIQKIIPSAIVTYEAPHKYCACCGGDGVQITWKEE